MFKDAKSVLSHKCCQAVNFRSTDCNINAHLILV